MLTNNPDGFVLLLVVLGIVLILLIWKKLISKNSKLTFDNAENIFIYFLGVILIFVAVYLKFTER